MATTPDNELNQIKQLVKIRQFLVDADRKHQEIRLAPWQLALGGITAGAAIFASGAAFTKLFL